MTTCTKPRTRYIDIGGPGWGAYGRGGEGLDPVCISSRGVTHMMKKAVSGMSWVGGRVKPAVWALSGVLVVHTKTRQDVQSPTGTRQDPQSVQR